MNLKELWDSAPMPEDEIPFARPSLDTGADLARAVKGKKYVLLTWTEGDGKPYVEIHSNDESPTKEMVASMLYRWLGLFKFYYLKGVYRD